jgi:hypothetical protein
MLWIIIAVIILLIAVAYFATRKNPEAVATEEEVEIHTPSQPVIPSPSEPNFYQQSAPAATIAPATTTPEMPVLTAPVAPADVVVDKGLFEINLKGDTGSEKMVVTIDGIRYPSQQDTYVLTKELQKIRIETPRKVDLSNVSLKDMSPARDANGGDTNIRVASIYVNGSNENVRSRLFQNGADATKLNHISNGLWYWGGELTFASPTTVLDPSAQANTTLPSTTGTIEITAKGDVGNEQIRVVVDGLTYPSPAGVLNEDGTPSIGAYVTPFEGAKILVRTPRRVDLSNVTIKFVNDAIDPDTKKDRNVRVSSIIINGDGQDVRPRLFRVGLDETRLKSLRAGGFFWGGDYTFV